MELSHEANDRDRFYRRTFVLVTCVVLALALFRILTPFLGPMLWAAFLAFLLYPLHLRLTRLLRNRPQASALLLTFAVLILFLGPLGAMAAAFAAQVGDLVRHGQELLANRTSSNGFDLASVPWPWAQDLLARLESLFDIDATQIGNWLRQGANEVLHWLASMGGRVFLGAIGTVVGFVLMLFLLFFFVRDGRDFLATARELIPMEEEQKSRLFDHLAAVTRAMVLGTGLTALIQGTLVGIAFLIVGLPSPLVFAVIAVLASLLPFGGTALVWVPAALVLAAQGRWGATIFMVIWGALLVSLVDNVVRPMLVSGRANVGTLTVFIGVLGGLAAFGAIGLFLGPVVLALIIALLRLFVEVRRAETVVVAPAVAAPVAAAPTAPQPPSTPSAE
ncbi:MAG TPA: AI-2E family transporter [Povalibacter sp.]|uniref:AI-2E family transporter n=1 Tax=Povalibacter sp. TaxID=1962978 RepID=UPI002CA4F613|nr:AI-2E family transporter [Povalibacter sp.]HMN47383.1 AI-2E family transporter [Povalibacter sp.]